MQSLNTYSHDNGEEHSFLAKVLQILLANSHLNRNIITRTEYVYNIYTRGLSSCRHLQHACSRKSTTPSLGALTLQNMSDILSTSVTTVVLGYNVMLCCKCVQTL
jgi:hypothetical protein